MILTSPVILYFYVKRLMVFDVFFELTVNSVRLLHLVAIPCALG